MIAPQYRLWLGVLLVLATGLAVSAQLPDRDDYAYGFPLAVEGDAEFYVADLPLTVYRSVADPLLRDAGVYNADGRPVPRKFEHPAADISSIEQKVKLGLVPLYGPQAEQRDQLRVLLHKDASGIALDMNAGELNGLEASEKDEAVTPASYIVDLRKLTQPLEALEFDWLSLPQGFIGRIRLEQSADLQEWGSLGTFTLAELRYEDTLIEEKRVKLSAKTTDYLRVSPQDMPESWRLNAVSGIYSETGAVAERDWLTVGGAQPGEAESEYFFYAGGYPPIDRVNLILPDENAVVRASIFSRPDEDQAWRLTISGIFYNLSRQGKVFQSTDIPMPEARAAFWKVRIDSGATSGTVRLRLGWRPDRLLFIAQGSPPFKLFTGRLNDKVEHFPQDRILGDSRIFQALRKSGQAGNAAIGARELIAGTQVLKPRTGISQGTILLWGGLIGAVLLVGWLVYTLLQDLKQS